MCNSACAMSANARTATVAECCESLLPRRRSLRPSSRRPRSPPRSLRVRSFLLRGLLLPGFWLFDFGPRVLGPRVREPRPAVSVAEPSASPASADAPDSEPASPLPSGDSPSAPSAPALRRRRRRRRRFCPSLPSPPSPSPRGSDEESPAGAGEPALAVRSDVGEESDPAEGPAGVAAGALGAGALGAGATGAGAAAAGATGGCLLVSLDAVGLLGGTLFGSDSFTGRKTMRPRAGSNKRRIEETAPAANTCRPSAYERHSLLVAVLLRSGAISQPI